MQNARKLLEQVETPQNIKTVTVEEACAHGLISREILGRCRYDSQSQASPDLLPQALGSHTRL